MLFENHKLGTKIFRRNAVLDERVAAEIYSHKLKLLSPTSFKSCFEPVKIRMRGESTRLCLHYGVSSKTIRDIWNRRSWAEATIHLWKSEAKTNQANSLFNKVSLGSFIPIQSIF